MANTYRKIYLQVVFAVKHRQALLHQSWRKEVFRYMAGSINQRGHYSLAVNGWDDHVHLFFDYRGRELVEDLVRDIKRSSGQFIRDRNLTPIPFHWQSGYGVFSHNWREKSRVIDYILHQEEHHIHKSFQTEYLKTLDDYEVEYKDEYLFDFFT